MNPPLTPAMYFALRALVRRPQHAYSLRQMIEQQSHGTVLLTSASMKHVLERAIDKGWVTDCLVAGRMTYVLEEKAARTVINHEITRLKHAAAEGTMSLALTSRQREFESF